MVFKLISFGIILTLFVSCSSTTSTNYAFDPVKAVNVIDVVIPATVRLGVAHEPKSAKFLSAVASAIDAFVSSNQFDPDQFNVAISSIGVNELKTPECLAVIDTILALYRVYYRDVIVQKLDKNNLTMILLEISTNIKRTLLTIK